jgi:cytochrome c oxidase subunit 2
MNMCPGALRKRSVGLPLALSLASLSGSASAAWELNLPVGVTPLSAIVYDLHMLILWICVLIGVVVFGVMFYSIVYHRKSRGHEAAHFHHSAFAEIAWTVIPCIILIGMAIPSTTTLIEMEDTSDPDMTLKVTGYQWKWRYDYLEDGVTFYSNLAPESRRAIYEVGGPQDRAEKYLLEVDNPVVLPTDRKVRILLTADDVIHAWWVPELGQKKDAIPGFVNEIWTRIEKPGIYRGQCAELCGKDHGFMPIVVIAKPEEEYRAWVEEQKQAQAEAQAAALREWTRPELMAKGEAVYASACAGCHQLDGGGVPHHIAAIAGSDVATGDLDQHLKVVLEGRAGTTMRAFGTELDDVELAALMTYQRNAFGNATGDLVQPATVAVARLNLGD